MLGDVLADIGIAVIGRGRELAAEVVSG